MIEKINPNQVELKVRENLPISHLTTEFQKKLMRCNKCGSEVEGDGRSTFCKVCGLGIIELKEENYDNTWDVIGEQIKKNKGERMNWKDVLGTSVNKYVARKRKDGYTAQETFEEVYKEHPELDEETLEKLKIGVYARFGEMKSAEEEI